MPELYAGPSAGLAHALTPLINACVSGMPPYCAFDIEQAQHVIDNAALLWSHHYGDEGYRAEVIASMESGRILAAAQWSHGPGPFAALLWAFAEPDAASALAEVLGTVARRAGDLGYRRLLTIRHGFGVGWPGVPATWTPVIRALTETGFKAVRRWQLMICSTEGSATFMAPGVAFRHETTRPDEDRCVALKDGNEIGECLAWAIPGRFRACAGASGWTTIEWLEVQPAYQGKGIGRALLAEQLRRQREQGIERVLVWTEDDNLATQRVNRAVGFTNGPVCIDFEWELS